MTTTATSRPGTYPAEPPPSLTDARAIADHEWHAFQQLPSTANHWDRPGWPPGHRGLYWFLTTEHAPAVQSLARRCQEHLAFPGLDHTPASGLHITLTRVNTGSLSQNEAANAVTKAARERCTDLEPFTLNAVPLTGSKGAIRFSLAPWTPLLELHCALTDAATDAGLPLGKPTAAFRPHLGIAYSNRAGDPGPLREAITPLRSMPAAELPIRTVRLVELRREAHSYRWNTLEMLDLNPPVRGTTCST